MFKYKYLWYGAFTKYFLCFIYFINYCVSDQFYLYIEILISEIEIFFLVDYAMSIDIFVILRSIFFFKFLMIDDLLRTNIQMKSHEIEVIKEIL